MTSSAWSMADLAWQSRRGFKLSPSTFVFHDADAGELKGIMAIHVEDIRMAFSQEYEYVFQQRKGSGHVEVPVDVGQTRA